MTERSTIKTIFDSAFGSLMALGVAGLSFGVYDQNVMSGLFGVICILIGVVVNYSRNTWNEGEKLKMEGRMKESVENRIVSKLK